MDYKLLAAAIGRWLFLMPIWFIGYYILPWFLVPVAVLMADADGRLPWIFRWLETHDNLGWDALKTEDAVWAFTERYGQTLGMIRWLYRNRAYTFRDWLGIPFHNRLVLWRVVAQRGAYLRPRFGPYLYYLVADCDGKYYFEVQLGFGFYWFCLYSRNGWKVKSLQNETGYPDNNTGIYTGITPRIDDYDGR